MNEKELWIQKLKKLCSQKEICVFDVNEKLKNANLISDEKEEIIKILCQLGFIDEKRYAKAFVHDKLYFNKWGRLKIKYALKQKKIDEEIINKTIYEINDEDYLQNFINVAKIKLKSLKKEDELKQMQKLIQYLMQKGIEYEVANEIWKKLKNDVL